MNGLRVEHWDYDELKMFAKYIRSIILFIEQISDDALGTEGGW